MRGTTLSQWDAASGLAAAQLRWVVAMRFPPDGTETPGRCRSTTRHGSSRFGATRTGLAAMLIALALIVPVATPGRAGAAEMIYVHERGCPYCRRWEREIGPAYPLSDSGRRAPLRAIELHDVPGSGLPLQRPARYTPTFVLIDGGREVGRIEGYPGAEFFWGLLDQLVAKLPPEPPLQAPPSASTRTSVSPR